MQIVFRLCLEGWVDSEKMLDAQIRIEQIWLRLRHTGPGTKSSSWFGSFCCFFFFLLHRIIQWNYTPDFGPGSERVLCNHALKAQFLSSCKFNFLFYLYPEARKEQAEVSYQLTTVQKRSDDPLTSVLPVYWNIRDFHSSSLFNFYAV